MSSVSQLSKESADLLQRRAGKRKSRDLIIRDFGQQWSEIKERYHAEADDLKYRFRKKHRFLELDDGSSKLHAYSQLRALLLPQTVRRLCEYLRETKLHWTQWRLALKERKERRQLRFKYQADLDMLFDEINSTIGVSDETEQIRCYGGDFGSQEDLATILEEEENAVHISHDVEPPWTIKPNDPQSSQSALLEDRSSLRPRRGG